MDSNGKLCHSLVKFDETFTSTMFLNMDQLDKDEFQEDRSMTAFWVFNSSVKKSIAERTRHQRQYDRRVNKRQMQKQENKVDTGKALDVGLVVTKSSGSESEVQDESSKSGNDTNADDADIRPVYDEEPMAEEKVFTTLPLKNKLRKLTGSSVDTKFAKPSILGKPHLKPLRNQSVVRQPTAFKSKGPQFLKSRVAFQVDVKNDLSKPVIPHYWPKVRESAFAKPPHVIASSESRNSSKNMSSSNQKKYLSSNDMLHNYYLVEARKKTQDKNKNSKTSVIPSAKLKHTSNGSKPKLRSTNQITRNWPASKSSCVTITAVHIANHSRNSRSFSDSKHFVCLTCQKCIFNVSHDACITKLLKEVNSHAKKQSHKTRNKNKPVEQKSHTQKLEWWISTGQKFSPNKTYAVYEKTTSPRSCLRWKPKGIIFKTVGLRWIPTRKIVETCINTNDSAIPLGKKTCTPNTVICAKFSSQIAGLDDRVTTSFQQHHIHYHMLMLKL
ncbi:hypothetical protein Tco_0348719 [Tanacetum coccineum]